MSLKEHYKFNTKKSLKPYIKLMILLFSVIIISHTLGKYEHKTVNNGVVSIAKWHIKINGEEITNTKTSLEGKVNLLNVKDNKNNIEAGDECYFDITINPETTEVAISYSISIDLNESNLPEGTKISKYEKYINTKENEQLDNTENVNAKTVSIIENIFLPETQTELDNTSIRRYRIYCTIPTSAEFEKDNNINITPKIIVKQYINS